MITPGQFEVPGQTPITDPLQLQFMTQGQMGYMPQAQFLTPYQYGNFRTMPTPNVMGYAAQETGLIQNMLVANRGSDPFGILPTYMFDTYNPAVNARQQQLYAQRRIEDSRAAMLPMAADLAASLMTIPMGLPGLAASMLIPDWMSPSEMVAQRRKSTREIQNLTTSKIFTGSDKDKGLGYGFGYNQARNLDRYIRESAADDSLMKEGDWRDMLSLGMKYGQFDYANNAEQYKRILKNMRGNMTTMMEVIGSTDFEEIMKNMKRMQDMGAQQEHYMSIARKEQQYARVTGLDHQQMVDTYGQSGALTFQQMGLNAMQGSITSMGNAALATYLQRTGAIDPTLMAHFGGVSGMAQQMTQASAKAHRNIADTLLAGMMNDDFTGLAEGLDLMRISQDPAGMDKLLAGAGRVNTIGKQRRFNVNRHKAYADLQEKYGPEVLEAMMAKMAGQRLTGGEGDDALFYGYQALGYSSEEAEARLAMVKSGGIWEMQKQAKEEQRRKAKEEREQRTSPLNKLGRWFEGMKNWLGEKTYGFFTPSGVVPENLAASASANGQTVNARAAASSGGGSGSSNNIVLGNSIPSNVTGGKYDYYWKHRDELDALALTFEVSNPEKGMFEVETDNRGTAYGNYQTNSAEGSQQDWLTEMYNSGDTGKGIVERIMRAGGITGDINEKNVRSLLDKVNWNKGSAAANQYSKEVEGNYDFMKNSQFLYIKHNYDDALRDIKQSNPGLGQLIESDWQLQQQLFSVVVQHGKGGIGIDKGAVSVFSEFYRPGMSAEELSTAIQLNRSKRFSDPGVSENQRLHRTPEELAVINASRRVDQGETMWVSASGQKVKVAGLANIGEETSSQLASRAVASYSKQGIERGVTYAYGVKNSVVPGQKDTNGNVHSGYSIDCSGLGMEELDYIVDNAKALSGGVDIYDPRKIALIRAHHENEGAAGMIRGAVEAGATKYSGNEVSKELVQKNGVMLFGVHASRKDNGRYDKIDHFMMAYVDENGQVRLSDSSGSKNGMADRTWEEWQADWKKSGIAVRGIDAVALEDLKSEGITGNIVKEGTSGVGRDSKRGKVAGASIGPAKRRLPPGVEQIPEGETQETLDADQREAGKAASEYLSKQLGTKIRLGSSFGTKYYEMEAGDIYHYTSNVGRGLSGRKAENKELYEKEQEALEKYYNDLYAEEQRKAGVSEADIKKLSHEQLGTLLRNSGDAATEDLTQFLGAMTKNEMLKDEVFRQNPNAEITFENVDIHKMAKNNAAFRRELEAASMFGLSGETAERAAFNVFMKGGSRDWAQTRAVQEGIGSNIENVVDEMKASYDRANEIHNKEDETRLRRVQEAGKQMLFGGNPSSSESKAYDTYFEDITGDKTIENGKVFARGAYAEKIPAVSQALGHLAAIENEIRNSGPGIPPDKLRVLSNRREEAINTVLSVMRAYQVPENIIREILDKHKDVESQIRELSIEMGRIQGGYNLNSKQQFGAIEIAKMSQEKYADVYSDTGFTNWNTTYYDEGEDGEFFGGGGPLGLRRGKDTKKFEQAGQDLYNLRTDKELNARIRNKKLETYQRQNDVERANMLWMNLSGLSLQELENLPNLDQSTVDKAVGLLRANGLDDKADTLEAFRKAGKTLSQDQSVKILYDENGNLRDVQRSVDEYSRDIDDINAQQGNVLKGTSPPGVMGGITPEASAALQDLPGALNRLSDSIDSLNGLIQGPNGWRPNPSQPQTVQH